MLREIRLLGMGEMNALFPEAELAGERWMGMVKSIVAIKRDVREEGERGIP